MIGWMRGRSLTYCAATTFGEIRLRPQMEVWFCAIAGTDAARHHALIGIGKSEQN